jgi:catechol 2,3-dioxygenase-like lactoylglutathione lyase family enzyme
MAIARYSLVALDCPDPYALARFYSAITGWPLRPESAGIEEGEAGEPGEWVQLDAGDAATIAFQRAPGHVAPEWPGDAHPQQAHLDFDVDDLDEGERQVLALGARKTEYQPGRTFRVFLDPVGHPFCLVLAA